MPFPRLRSLAALLVAAASLVATARPAAATTITFAGSTLGCFGVGCTEVASATSNNLTFVGNAALAATVEDDNTDFENVSLGTFSIPPAPTRGNENVTPDSDFSLEVLFTLPGVSGNTYSALVSGKINPSNDSVTVTFAGTPTTLINFSNAGGSGSFYLSVLNDPVLSRVSTIGSTSVQLNGRIGNVTYVEGNGSGLAPVPEPASLLLLGTGMLGVAIRARRKKD